jgi:hypothetical protein
MENACTTLEGSNTCDTAAHDRCRTVCGPMQRLLCDADRPRAASCMSCCHPYSHERITQPPSTGDAASWCRPTTTTRHSVNALQALCGCSLARKSGESLHQTWMQRGYVCVHCTGRAEAQQRQQRAAATRVHGKTSATQPWQKCMEETTLEATAKASCIACTHQSHTAILVHTATNPAV